MNTDKALCAFFDEFKTQILRQIEELNIIADGALQDGYNAWYLDDGWISLEGFSWGFVMQEGEPACIDMTFGPGWPFVGYRDSFVNKQVGEQMAWVNQAKADEVFFDAEQLARYGLRKLAWKTGDSWLFDGNYKPVAQPSTFMSVHHDSYREHI